MKHIIVSRHPAAVEFIRAEAPEFADAPVLASATRQDVTGAVVAGNLPLHLAQWAAEVVAVEFAGEPPRGNEYGLAEMRAAGAHLSRYVVFLAPNASASPPPPVPVPGCTPASAVWEGETGFLTTQEGEPVRLTVGGTARLLAALIAAASEAKIALVAPWADWGEKS